jgi:hypothetical protein
VGEESRQNKASGSLFVGGGSGGKAAKTRTSLMPHQSYSEKKAIAKDIIRAENGKPARDGDVYARSQIASQSLTGETSSGKPAQIKGASVTPTMAKIIQVGELQKELGATEAARQAPFQEGPRLEQELKRGNDRAEQAAQQIQVKKAPRPPQIQTQA